MKRPSAFYKLVYHFTWATRDRLPLITPSVEARLLPCIGYKCKELGYRRHAVNSIPDHLHILISLTPSILVADVAKNIKGASSHYINKESELDETLYWQDGYGVAMLRQSEIPKVVEYIQHQKEHHRVGKLSRIFEQTHE